MTILLRSVVLSLIFIVSFCIQSNQQVCFASEPVLIDSFGIWTLEDLGYSDLIFPCEEDIESISVEYRLPQNASQGPSTWYIIHLDFGIEFSGLSEDGFCDVSASTNGSTCAQFQFEPQMTEGHPVIDWSTVDLINGEKEYTTSSLSINASEAEFSNYLQYTGVKPGINDLTFRLEQYDGAKVENLIIYKTTAIEYSPLALPNLVMSVDVPDISVSVGDRFSIGFELRNTGDVSAANVIVQPIFPDGSLETIGDGYSFVETLDSLHPLYGVFEFRALSEGEYILIIDVDTSSGIERPSISIQVPIGQKRPFAFTVPIVSGSILILLLSYLWIRKRIGNITNAKQKLLNFKIHAGLIIKGNYFSIISLILSVMAFLLYPIFVGPFALVFGLGSFLHKENRKLVAAAIICSILLPGIMMLFSFLGLIGGLLWAD